MAQLTPDGIDKPGAVQAAAIAMLVAQPLEDPLGGVLLFALGAIAVIRHARTKSASEATWLKGLLDRRPAKLVAVAQANKNARIVWALLTRGGTYRAQVAAQAVAP